MESFSIANLVVKIGPDNDAPHPREDWDTVGTMVTSHRRYKLGDIQVSDLDVHLFDLMQEREWRENQKDIPEDVDQRHVERYINKHWWILPVYMYDHSGLSLSTDVFNCPWDSGKIGYIYVEKDAPNLVSYFNDQEHHEAVKRILTHEIEVYSTFLEGGFYIYDVLDQNGNVLDSCGCFYDAASAKEAGTEAAMSIAKTLEVDYVI